MSFLPSIHSLLSKSNPTSHLTDDPAYDPSLTSPSALQLSSSLTRTREVSLIEQGPVHVGVTFTPKLGEQRIAWALEVLAKERVGSVLDVGCGEGALLSVLCRPSGGRKGEEVRAGNGRRVGRELVVTRLAGLDIDPTCIPLAVQATAPPPSSSDPPASSTSTSTPTSTSTSTSTSNSPPPPTTTTTTYIPPRWQQLEVEIWQGGLEKHNQRLEGYEAIVGLEIIEHLNGPSLAVFPQMIFGTFRPKIVLITTPNFEFNSKFPRAETCDDHHHHHEPHERDGAGSDNPNTGLTTGTTTTATTTTAAPAAPATTQAIRGFLDPTGRTERVFRHSDHKLEMTESEFRDWCESAEEWGYTAEIGGIGLSNNPSYHQDDPTRPIYATHTAVFRHTGAPPHRSPRSVRSVQLPFMPLSGEEFHAHRLAARHVHPVRLPHGTGERPGSSEEIRKEVQTLLVRWDEPVVGLEEVWAHEQVPAVCSGSRRALVRALGGIGDCPGDSGRVGDQPDWTLDWNGGTFGRLRIRYNVLADERRGRGRDAEQEEWGRQEEREVVMTDTSGW